MGNVMAGLGLVLLGFILLQVANTFFLYPARNKVNTGWVYYALKGTSYFLFVLGTVFIVIGYL